MTPRYPTGSGATFVDMMLDLDGLLATQNRLLLGAWIQRARASALPFPEPPLVEEPSKAAVHVDDSGGSFDSEISSTAALLQYTHHSMLLLV